MTADPVSPKSSRGVDEILAAASEESRAALKVLGELVGNEPASVATPAQFATCHLGIDPLALSSTRFTGPSTSLAILGNMLRIEIAKHGDAVLIGSPGDGLPPTWSQLDLGLDEHGAQEQASRLRLPGVAGFPGTDELRHFARMLGGRIQQIDLAQPLGPTVTFGEEGPLLFGMAHLTLPNGSGGRCGHWVLSKQQPHAAIDLVSDLDMDGDDKESDEKYENNKGLQIISA